MPKVHSPALRRSTKWMEWQASGYTMQSGKLSNTCTAKTLPPMD